MPPKRRDHPPRNPTYRVTGGLLLGTYAGTYPVFWMGRTWLAPPFRMWPSTGMPRCDGSFVTLTSHAGSGYTDDDYSFFRKLISKKSFIYILISKCTTLHNYTLPSHKVASEHPQKTRFSRVFKFAILKYPTALIPSHFDLFFAVK